MKRILSIILIGLLFTACSSSLSLLRKGQYDAAIDKSVKKLMKDPTDEGQIDILTRAYTLANEKDNNIINELRISGQPDIWEEVFARFSNLRTRQDKVSRLPIEVLNKIGYQRIDYNREVAEAKNKAAAFYYANGQKLLDSGVRMDARKAYDQFLFIRKYFPNYLDVDKKLEQARLQGTNHVLFKIQNQARVSLPDDFEEEILKVSLSSLDQQWLQFDNYEVQGEYYDYFILLNLKHIEVSPQSLMNEKYTDTKRVEDGWEYVLDNRGNVMKDSLGNDMKRTKYKDVNAYITTTQMDKKAIVTGTLDYYNNTTGQLVKTAPISCEFIFDYEYATFAGEAIALSEKSKKVTRNKPKNFPTDLQMIYDTNTELKRIAFEMVKADKNLFLN